MPWMKHYDTSTGEFSFIFLAYEEMVRQYAANFDCHQIAYGLENDMTPQECGEMCNLEYAERNVFPYGDPLDHDYSMNA